MGLRTLADEEGRQWQIWDVHPTRARRDPQEEVAAGQRAPHRSTVTLPATLQSGWLAFQCNEDSRRLAPIPAGWESMPDHVLISLITFAKPARSRAG